ncbi:SANT/Myb domain [Macleaya cordata]|uniref:SANT/Myb domain n=1 Tax=Macleaya cordata TaxID=56857 RepID=A0A200RCU1_MACCD|nr:SANT/Myb domain [Macleaya cordata]
MEKGSISPRTDVFPAGLRVLVVDDDPTWLKILEKMLIKCNYEVTTCCLAREALEILRERKDGFDIVISDVNMPDMDGFKLLEHVGLEMDLPVIMMSVDGETSRVMKAFNMERVIIFSSLKKIHEVKEIESQEGNEDTLKMRNGLFEFDSCYLLTGGDLSLSKKRKDMENQEHDDHDFNDHISAKKARVVWSVDLHQKFVKAVNQIGFDKVGPKKILDLMNVPWLTRENVASHLQKYRMYLSRLQKQNEPKNSFCAIKQQDFISKDPSTSFGFQGSITMHQNSAASCSFGYSGNNILIQDVSPRIHEDLNGIGSILSVTEPRKTSSDEIADPQKANHSSRMGLTHSFGSLGQDVNYTSFGSTIPQQISWGGKIPKVQFMEQPKEEQEPYPYTNQPLPASEHHLHADQLQSAAFSISGTSIAERPSEIKQLCTEYRNDHVRNVCQTECTIDLFYAQPNTDIVNTQAFGATFTRLPSIKSQSFDQNFLCNLEPHQKNFVKRSGSTSVSSEEQQQLCSLQDYGYFENVEHNNREILNGSEPITELPSHMYDGLRFNIDYLREIMEYPIMDQRLFIA